jgi:hypothetical protein
VSFFLITGRRIVTQVEVAKTVVKVKSVINKGFSHSAWHESAALYVGHYLKYVINWPPLLHLGFTFEESR